MVRREGGGEEDGAADGGGEEAGEEEVGDGTGEEGGGCQVGEEGGAGVVGLAGRGLVEVEGCQGGYVGEGRDELGRGAVDLVDAEADGAA